MKWPVRASVIQRTMDAAFLNRVANDPAVRPWLGGDGMLDVAPRIANPLNLAGVSDDGGFLAQSLGDGRYEIHSLFLPTRSIGAVRAMRDGLDYLFATTDATELLTKVPDDNPAADGLAQLAGFSRVFSLIADWSVGVKKTVHVGSLHIDDWAMHSKVCLCMGRWLHEQFAAVFAERGSSQPPHSDQDETHDRMAGAAAMMIRAGNTAKGVLFYNRWAALSGYPVITWLRDHPVVLDLEGMIVEVTSEDIEVLTCQ